MSGHRKAAVALHALSGEDRQWVLAKLPSDDGQRLQQYLNELDDLGFTHDKLPQLTTAPLKRVVPTEPSNPAAVLASASPLQLHAILQPEPDALIAELLSAQQWTWADAVMSMLAPPKRDAVRAHMQARTPQGALRTRYLIECCAAQVQACQSQPVALDAAANRTTTTRNEIRALFKQWLSRWKQ